MLCGVGCTYPSIHFSLDEDTLKITVGCLTSAYPSIHVETLRITVGCPLCTYPSIRILTTLKLSRDHGRLPAVHISKHSQQKLAHVRAVGTSTRAVAWCRPPRTRTGRRRGRHPTPGDPALWTRAKQKRKFGQKGRLTKKRDLFITGIFPARNLFFITVLNKFQKLAAGENYSHYSFILIPKQ